MNASRKPGAFIVVEGTNFSGKGFLIDQMTADLTANSHRIHITKEPGGTPIGEKFRVALKETDGVDDFARALGMNASRAELVRKVILPRVAAGETVVSDRWLDSTVVFQTIIGQTNELESIVIADIHRLFPTPRLTIFVVPTKELLEKRWKEGRKETDVFEKDPFRERDAYLFQASRKMKECKNTANGVVLIEPTLENQDAFAILRGTPEYKTLIP